MDTNLETINKVYEAFGKRDIPFILDCLSDDVKWEQWNDNTAQKSGVPWLVAKEGKSGVAEFFNSLTGYQINDFKLLSLMSNEDQVAAEVQVEFNVSGSDKNFNDEEMHLWTFNKDGKIVRMRHYVDTAKHIASLK